MIGRIHCAIYTRKSSEEGLDQAFNSLDAQREACEAFIRSQKHEGWIPISAKYDDGGFSGGNMGRPALKRLMADISEGKVNTVVVYKVDRLTRSLADFAKIIEQFDAKGISFVSVTQQFNTTTSMGRLTLNVLLSFAQFEREVTGERIRDKIAASKAKGMWMGGRVPLGYDLRDRNLYINAEDANTVREIFNQYLRLGTVPALVTHLRTADIRSKIRKNTDGTKVGGGCYSRGALYQLLRNHLYVGEIKHKGAIHSARHEGIIDRKTWERTQALLDQNRLGKRDRSRTASGSSLTGLLFSETGVRYIPTSTQKGGRRYYYYTSQAVIKGESKAGLIGRLPAPAIERAVLARLKQFLGSRSDVLDALRELDLNAASVQKVLKEAAQWTLSEANDLIRSVVKRVVVSSEALEFQINLGALAKEAASQTWSVSAPFRHVPQGKILKLVIGDEAPSRNGGNEAALKAIARARGWYQQIVRGEVGSIPELARLNRVTPRYVKTILPCAFLAPSIVESLVNGNSRHLTLSELRNDVHARWDRQKLIVD